MYCARSVAAIRTPSNPIRNSLWLWTMPLRAKVQDPTYGRTQKMRYSNEIPQELPDDEPDDVLFTSSYGVRVIELNRPKKLNSLNGSMCRKIIPRLKEWEKSDMVNAIIMKGAGEKALCAGGDVAALAKWNQEGPEGRQRSRDYFALEYKLDHLIATYPKPYVAFMDGITMGGGVGLSVHAPFRIATERTVFAMPETTIGFFPEVGASFFLPRMDGQLGKYLALTSDRLQGIQAFYHGVATHYVHSSSLPDLENRIAELDLPDHASYDDRCRVINNAVAEFAAGLPHDQPIQLSGGLRKVIDRCFGHDSISKILEDLEAETEHRDWAQKTLATIKQRSPTSLKVTLNQLGLGKSWNIAQTFEWECVIAGVFMDHHDFVEGVSSRLIAKPPKTPEWQPPTLDDVTSADVKKFFVTPEGDRKLNLLRHGPETEYSQYPHAWIGLPSENEVEELLRGGSFKSKDQVIGHFLEKSRNKVGVREKIEEILDRKTSSQDQGLRWNS